MAQIKILAVIIGSVVVLFVSMAAGMQTTEPESGTDGVLQAVYDGETDAAFVGR